MYKTGPVCKKQYVMLVSRGYGSYTLPPYYRCVSCDWIGAPWIIEKLNNSNRSVEPEMVYLVELLGAIKSYD